MCASAWLESNFKARSSALCPSPLHPNVAPEFLKVANELKTTISDHRDYEIAHDKSPRNLYGTLQDSEGKTRIAKHRLNPTERDRQVETAPLDELLAAADSYVQMATEIVKNNQSKSALTKQETVLAKLAPAGVSER